MGAGRYSQAKNAMYDPVTSHQYLLPASVAYIWVKTNMNANPVKNIGHMSALSKKAVLYMATTTAWIATWLSGAIIHLLSR